MKLKKNDILLKYAEIQFIYINHLQGTLYMYYSDLLTKGRIEFMCNSRWDKCIKKMCSFLVFLEQNSSEILE